MKSEIEAFVGKPASGQLPVTPSSVPEVYMTASGWGIRVDMSGKERHGELGGDETISMPPEHWRYTVLNILHFTQGHMGHGFTCDDCPRCAAIAYALRDRYEFE